MRVVVVTEWWLPVPDWSYLTFLTLKLSLASSPNWHVARNSVSTHVCPTLVVPKYLFRQGTRNYRLVTISYDESHRYRLSLLSHLLTFGCPNRPLGLIDRFLEGQRAYYTPCQIPSRRCESVHYSIVKWWLNLLLCFELIFLLSWWGHSISGQTQGN